MGTSLDDLIAAVNQLRVNYTASTSTAYTVQLGGITWGTSTNSTTSPLQTSGTTAGTSPAPAERAEPMATGDYKAPEVIPGFRAEDPDTIHMIDQVGVLIKEQRLGNLVALLNYNQKVETIFNGRQAQRIQGEVQSLLWEQ